MEVQGTQGLESKQGEVRFRRKLFEQQVLGRQVFDDEFDAAEIEEVLRERMARTVRDMAELQEAGLTVSPYVELGAERGQRALALENTLGLSGAAVDLSLDLLGSCEHYRRRFGLDRGPLRICGDVYRLPFASSSVPFVFCYQTLHHFPDPTPVVSEVHRVLMPGGHFYFSEEPYRRRLRWRFYQVKRGSRDRTGRGRFRRLLDRVFAEEVVNEQDFGVIENHDLSVAEWRSSLAVFEDVRLTLRYARRLRVDPDRSWNVPARVAARLLGGLISGVCRKAGALPPGQTPEVGASLICPAALAAGDERPLHREGRGWSTEGGGIRYGTVDGVHVLLEPGLREQLYPELDQPDPVTGS